MTKTITLSLPDEVIRSAETMAAETDGSVDDILQAWLQSGMVHRLSNALMVEGGIVPADALSAEDEAQLAQLLRAFYADELGDEANTQLDDLLHRYRQSSIEEARSLTDWLAMGGTRGLGSPVSQLVTMRSNMLYAVGYDAEKQVLDVVFNSGGVYRYFDVPSHIYQGLLKAPSAGRYMWDHVFSVYANVRLDRKRGTRRVMSRQRRQIGKAA